MAKSFFDYYPDQIFAPLSGANGRVCLDILLSIYKKFFGESSDIDDLSSPATHIRAHIETILISSKHWVDEEPQQTTVQSKETDLVQRTHHIYNRLVDTGWLKVERMGHKDHVFMSPRCTELLQFLDSAGRDVSKHVGGSVLNVYRALRGITEQGATDSDIALSLEQAVMDSLSMGKRMNNLAMHLRDITEKLNEFTDTNQKAESFFENFVNESSFADYIDMKKDEHPIRFKSDILGFLDQIEYDHQLKRRVLKAIGKTISTEPADEYLESSVRSIRSVFTNTDNLLDRIDKTHNKLAYRFNQAIRYRRRAGSDIRMLLEQALEGIRERQALDDITLPSPMADVSAVSQDHLFKLKRKKSEIKPDSSTEIRHVSSETRIKLELHREYLQNMTINQAKLNDWLESVIGQNRHIDSLNIAIERPQDFAMFVQSLRLCTSSTHFHKKYADTLRLFSFTRSSQAVVEHEAVYCPEFTITRRVHQGTAHV